MYILVLSIPFGVIFYVIYKVLSKSNKLGKSVIDVVKEEVSNRVEDMKFKYFTLEELIHSNTAVAKGIDNTPNDEQRENLSWLIMNFLDPIREEFGEAIIVTSGFRSKALNSALAGSSSKSAHMEGLAADLQPKDNTEAKRKKLFAICAKYKVDQLLYEHNSKGSKWIHLGTRKVNPRGYINNNYDAKV